MLRRFRLFARLFALVLAVLVTGETTDLLCAEPGCGAVHVCPDGDTHAAENVPGDAGTPTEAHDPGCSDAAPSDAGGACLCHAVFETEGGWTGQIAVREGRTLALHRRAPQAPRPRADAVRVPPPLG